MKILFDRESIEEVINQQIASGMSTTEIAEQWQIAYKMKTIDAETFFTARDIYLEKAGLGFLCGSKDELVAEVIGL